MNYDREVDLDIIFFFLHESPWVPHGKNTPRAIHGQPMGSPQTVRVFFMNIYGPPMRIARAGRRQLRTTHRPFAEAHRKSMSIPRTSCGQPADNPRTPHRKPTGSSRTGPWTFVFKNCFGRSMRRNIRGHPANSPWAATDSPQAAYGQPTDILRTAHGEFVNSPQTLNGRPMGNPRAVHKQPTRTACSMNHHGLSMASNIRRHPMDSSRTFHGQSTDRSKDSPRALCRELANRRGHAA